MAELTSPAGTVVQVDDELAKRLVAHGWKAAKKAASKPAQKTEK